MDFIKKENEDLSKVIIAIEKTKNGNYTKKIYNSLLDMPESERLAYIAQAFAKISEKQATAEETWKRICLERALDRKLAKTSQNQH